MENLTVCVKQLKKCLKSLITDNYYVKPDITSVVVFIIGNSINCVI